VGDPVYEKEATGKGGPGSYRMAEKIRNQPKGRGTVGGNGAQFMEIKGKKNEHTKKVFRVWKGWD